MTTDPTGPLATDVEDIRRGAQVRLDVQTDGGAVLLSIIEAQLGERMQRLAKADPACQAYLGLLDTIGYHVRTAAAKSAKAFLKDVGGLDFEDTDAL